MRPHFFFGTLRDREVLETVLGRRLDGLAHEAASVPGHRLARVTEESYPALVADRSGAVEGELVRGLETADVLRIAWFEGREYANATVEAVILATGAREEVTIHLPTGSLEIEDGAWDYAAWLRDEKDALLHLTRGHMALFGEIGIDEAIERWDERREAVERERRGMGERERRGS